MSRKPIKFTSIFDGWRRALLTSERSNSDTATKYQALAHKYDSLLGVAKRVEENFKRAEARIRRMRREWDEEHEVMESQLTRTCEQLETAKRSIVKQSNDLAQLFADNTARAAKDCEDKLRKDELIRTLEREIKEQARRLIVARHRETKLKARAVEAESLLGRIIIKRDRRVKVIEFVADAGTNTYEEPR